MNLSDYSQNHRPQGEAVFPNHFPINLRSMLHGKWEWILVRHSKGIQNREAKSEDG